MKKVYTFILAPDQIDDEEAIGYIRDDTLANLVIKFLRDEDGLEPGKDYTFRFEEQRVQRSIPWYSDPEYLEKAESIGNALEMSVTFEEVADG